jgi:O-antigen/teichoic acid export membrane protein
MARAGIRSIARNTALLTAAQLTGTLARVAYIVCAARLLGPELYARLAYSQSWYQSFLPIAILGLGPALVHVIAREPGRGAEVASEALSIRLVATAVAALACAALGALVTPDPATTPLILVLTLALAGRAVGAWAQHLFTAYEVTQYTLRQEVAFRLAEVVVAVAALLAGAGLLLLVSIHAACAWIQAAWSLGVVRRRILRPSLARQPARWAGLLALAVPFFLNSLAVDWRIYGSLVMFRSLHDDPVLFSQFALAMQAFVMLALVPFALVTAAQPVLVRSAARADGQDLVFAAVIQRYAFVGGAAIGLAGLALGPTVFRVMLGPAYEEAGRLAGLILWCLLPLAAGIGFPSVLVARGQLRLLTTISVGGALAMTLLLPLLVPVLQAEGAILAVAAGYVLPPLATFALAVQRGWGEPGALLLRPALAVLAAVAAYLLLAPLSSLMALGVALAVLAGSALALGVVRPQDRELLRAFL